MYNSGNAPVAMKKATARFTKRGSAQIPVPVPPAAASHLDLQSRNTELTVANNDLINLLANVSVPVVIVGKDLRIRRFTPQAQELLNFSAADIGRRLGEICPNLECEDLEQIVRDTVETATVREREVRERADRWHLMRVRPYRTSDDKIDGAVITFQDIDTLRRNLEQARNFSDAVIENAREPILILDEDLRVAVANAAFYRRFRVSRAETEGRLVRDLGGGQWNIPKLLELVTKVARDNTRLDDFDVQHDFPGLGLRHMALNARRIDFHDGRKLILLSIDDLTEQREQMEALKRQSALLELAHETIIVRELNGTILFWNRGAEEMYGWSREEVVGRSTHELFHTGFPTSLKKIEDELIRTGRWTGELIHTRRDGNRIIVSSRLVLMKEDRPQPVVLVINSDITAQKKSEEGLRLLSGDLMRLQDDERRRIARELHDSTGQKLAVIRMSLSMATRAGVTPKAAEFIKEGADLADQAATELRTIAQLLHPPELEHGGFVSAASGLVTGFSERSGILMRFEASPIIERLAQDQEIALFRIVQECLTNIHRHSGAQQGAVKLFQSQAAVTLEISDNGKGLPPQDGAQDSEGRRKTPGVGILGMKERLLQLGGTLEISSSSEGTVVRAMLPRKRQAS
jgi:PAS domain S-box-containing protein